MGGFKIEEKKEPFLKTLKYMRRTKRVLTDANLDAAGKAGVDALEEFTPKDSGKTSESWNYKVIRENGRAKIIWTNDNITGNSDVPIAMLLQYGHLTKDGYYLQGFDYINPALKPIFEDIANKIWKEATKV